MGGESYFLRGTKSPSPVLVNELKLNKFTRKKADSFLGYNRSVCMVDLPKWW